MLFYVVLIFLFGMIFAVITKFHVADEYQHVGDFISYIVTSMRLSIGDFDFDPVA